MSETMLKRSRILHMLEIIALLVAGQASFGASSGQVVEFPKLSVGRIFATTSATDFSNRHVETTNLCAAQGKVQKHKGVGFLLKLNYNGGSDLSFLNRLPVDALVGLDSNDIAIDVSKLSALQHLKTLRRLDLRNADITDTQLSCIKNMPIEYADFSKTMIRGPGLSVLKTLVHLRGLSVSFCPLDKTASAGIALAPALSELHISSTNVGDNDMANLAKIKKLTYLKASSNRNITDAGIAHLSNLSGLKTLDLSDTSATVNCLSSLQKLKTLKHLTISSPKLTPEDIAKISAAMPHCNVRGQKRTKVPLMLFDPLH